jgi:hypothetical protein
MSDVELQDALNEMKDRCFGLEVASAYFTDDDIMARGLTRLVAAVANQMAEIARAWEMERQIRVAESAV